MIPFFNPMHFTQDDLPPVDYTYAPSVAEARRRRQQENIHREETPAGPAVRHRAEPKGENGELPVYGAGLRRAQSLPSRMSEDQPAFAEPTWGQPATGVVPENPFQPPAETQQPRRRRTERAVEPAPQPETPKPQEMPDWLRVAQQNNLPLQNRPPRPAVQAAPRQNEPPVDALGRPVRRVTAAPKTAASPYEAAGYPQQLLDAQRQLEAEQAAAPIHRKHGAQYAVREHYAPKQPPAPTGMSYPPQRQAEPAPQRRRPVQEESGWQVETDEEELARELPAWVKKVPWLGIAAFAAALVAVVLWVQGIGYEKQMNQVLAERAAQELAIRDEHPLKYEELIAEKANKYNLDPAFVAAIIMNESSFRPNAMAERTKARGLMQLKADTGEWIYGKINPSAAFDAEDLFRPEINVELGCWYLNYLSELFWGDPVAVAAAYHAGQGEVRNWLNTAAYTNGQTLIIDKIPFSDTKRYVGRVMNHFAAYKRLYYGG